MYKKLFLITLLNCQLVSAMEHNPQQPVQPPAQQIMQHLPPRITMHDFRQEAGNSTHWFYTLEEMDAFEKKIAQTQLYKDMLKEPQKYAALLIKLNNEIHERFFGNLNACCQAFPTESIALALFFGTDGCCQFDKHAANTLLSTLFCCTTVAKYHYHKQTLRGMVKSSQNAFVLKNLLEDLTNKKNK